jgi:hypothetical protein
MNSIEAIREFFGWCAVINIGLLLLLKIEIFVNRNRIILFFAKLHNIDKSDLSRESLYFFGQSKVATWLFCIVPYFALRIMS